jgi:hypothetical protein
VFIRGSLSTSMGVERGGERTRVQPLVGGCMDVSSTETDTFGSECISGKLNVTTRCQGGTGPKIVSCGGTVFVVRGGKIFAGFGGTIFVVCGGSVCVPCGGKIFASCTGKTSVACGGTIYVCGGNVCVIHDGKIFVSCTGKIFVCEGNVCVIHGGKIFVLCTGKIFVCGGNVCLTHEGKYLCHARVEHLCAEVMRVRCGLSCEHRLERMCEAHPGPWRWL